MSYDKTKQFNNGETLNADELNQLVEGINGSVTSIVLGEGNATLIITNNKGDEETITLPSGGGNIDASEIVLDGLINPQITWTDENKAAACETIGAALKSDIDGLIGDISTLLNSILDLQEATE